MRDSPLDRFMFMKGICAYSLGFRANATLLLNLLMHLESRDNIHLGSIAFCSKEAFNFMLLNNSIILTHQN